MTREQAKALIGERFSSAQVDGDAPTSAEATASRPIVVTLPVDQWTAFAQFAKTTLGCRFFWFS